MPFAAGSTKSIAFLITVIVSITVILGIILSRDRINAPRQEYHARELIHLESIKKDVDFTIFAPTNLQNLVTLKPWTLYKEDAYGYVAVRIVFETLDNAGSDSAVVSIDQKKATHLDVEFLQRRIGEDDWFVYKDVLVGDTLGKLTTPKFDLPYKKTTFDPRLAPRLSFVKHDTFITLQTSDKTVFPIHELVKVAESLTPLR